MPSLFTDDSLRAAFLGALLAVLTSRGLDVGDSVVHFDQALALVEERDRALRIDPEGLWVTDVPLAGGLFWRDGETLRAAVPPGHSLLAAPPIALAEPFTERSRAEVVNHMFSPRPASVRAAVRPMQFDARVVAFMFFNAFCVAVMTFSLVRACEVLDIGQRARWIAVTALLVGTPWLAYAGTSWTQVPASAALSYAMWRLAARASQPGAGLRGAGWAMALTMLLRPELGVLVPLYVATLYFSERRWRRSPSRAVLKVLGPVFLGTLLLRYWGLPRYAGGFALEHASGIAGLTFSLRTGLLIFAPIVMLSPVGAVQLIRRERPLGWFVAVVVPMGILLYGVWFDWTGSSFVGPRFLLPMLPAALLLVALAVDQSRALSWAALLAALLGAAVNLPGALLVHLRVPDSAGFWDCESLHAWRTLISESDQAVGSFGIDCACTYVPAYGVVLGLIAMAWISFEIPWRRCGRDQNPESSGS